MHRSRLLLFDIDGTLINSDGAGRRALAATFKSRFGIDTGDGASKQVPFEGKTDPVIVAELAAAFGVDEREVRGSWRDFEAEYLRYLETELADPQTRGETLPGVDALLDTLSTEAGTHLGLLTGNIEAGARAKLEPFGLNRYFPSGGFGSDHADRRQVARIARERAESHSGESFAAEATVVIGDTLQDIDCARANGFRAVAVLTGFGDLRALREAEPDAVLEDLTDRETVRRAFGY